MSTPCIDCGTLTHRLRRCHACQRMADRRHNAQPQRRAYGDPAYRAIPLTGSCARCGSTHDLTRDHPHPLIKGGNNMQLITILCRSCNSSKGQRVTSHGHDVRKSGV